VLPGQAVRFVLVDTLESAERGSILVFHFAAMPVEERQRRAVAIAYTTLTIGDEDRFSQ
jgi:hypothetical protein